MNDTKIASKAKAQLASFMGKVFTHFSKPAKRFYTRIRNMASLVLASAYFATVWIGRHARREVLAEHIKRLGKRLNEVPEFAAYAIADGIRRAFTRFGRWIRAAALTAAADKEPPPAPLLPGFADLFDMDDG